MPDDLRCPRALHAEEFQRVHGRPVCVAGSSAGQARDGAAPVLGFAGGHRGPVPADGRGRGREAGLVAEPSALSARRGGMRDRGQDAERRLCRVREPLPRPHQLLRHAAVAAYRRGVEGDGARLRPAGLRRRQHEHRLPRPLDRRDRVRADLRRDEPARRRAVRASGRDRASARRSSSITISARRSAPRSRTRPSSCT